MMRATVLIAAGAMLVGCGTQKTMQVHVPVPVECKEHVPERPVMPTEQLEPGAEPFVLLRAALAEIDRREGYEVVMHAALVACTAPVQ